MFYNVFNLMIFYNIIQFKKDIAEEVRLVVLHGFATIDGGNKRNKRNNRKQAQISVMLQRKKRNAAARPLCRRAQ